MRKSALAVLFAFVVAPLFMGVLSPLGPALQSAAGRVADMTSLLILLNGTPQPLGVLTSTGTSVTQATTAAPFTFTAGGCYQVTCDPAGGNINIGATADTSITSANFGRYMPANTAQYWCVRDGDTTIALDAPAATTINCAVARMR